MYYIFLIRTYCICSGSFCVQCLHDSDSTTLSVDLEEVRTWSYSSQLKLHLALKYP